METLLGLVEIMTDLEADRKIDYLYFRDVKVPAKGKRPESSFVITTSELSKWTPVVEALDSNSVMLAINHALPLVCAKAKELYECEPGQLVKESFAQITGMVKEYEATKPGSGPSERKIPEYMVKSLADMILVAAGKTGEIPQSLDIQAYFGAAFVAAIEKAQKLGMDEIGQYRLKAAKVEKANESNEANEANEETGN